MKRFEVVFEAPVYYVVAPDQRAAEEAACYFQMLDASAGEVPDVATATETDEDEEYYVWHGEDKPDKEFGAYHAEDESRDCKTCQRRS